VKNNNFFSTMAIIIALFSTTPLCQAQTPLAPYEEVSFVKVSPGMNENYLAVNKVAKKPNPARKAAKAVSTWQLYKRVYPMHGSMAFDYATFTAFPCGKEMQARKDQAAPDAPAKDLTAKEISVSIRSLPTMKTADHDLYTFRLGAGGSAKTGDYVLLTRVKAAAGNLEAYEKMLETVKPAVEEAIKTGKLKSWHVWKCTQADAACDYTISFTFGSMDEALAYASSKVNVAAEFKKVYPAEDYAAFRAKQTSLREVVAQELWELVEVTD
jgi:hypothetical protein